MTLNAIDLFSGCGGLTQGLKQAGLRVKLAVEINKYAAETYNANHPNTLMLQEDIKNVSGGIIKSLIGTKIDVIAGCPPCQGFSSIRTLNNGSNVDDERNTLILEYLRIIKELKPKFVLLENVPNLLKYDLFNRTISELKFIGYNIDVKVVDVSNYQVPQRRKRLVMIGSLLHKVCIPAGKDKFNTVRDAIFNLPEPEQSNDPVHHVYAHHGKKVQEIIEMIPKDGGSRKDLPKKYWLKCHLKKGVGFSDVYGRLSWDKVSSTITGGCLNPSKGRFLHPEQNRCITAREAALLQTFPANYKFPVKSHTAIAQMIGNALPPKLSEIQGKYILNIASQKVTSNK